MPPSGHQQGTASQATGLASIKELEGNSLQFYMARGRLVSAMVWCGSVLTTGGQTWDPGKERP